jgi:hypothetical protein
MGGIRDMGELVDKWIVEAERGVWEVWEVWGVWEEKT